MMCCHFRRSVSPIPFLIKKISTQPALVLVLACSCLAQDETLAQPPSAPTEDSAVTIPAGTHLALVLTQPVQSRHVRRGDDIYAQIMAPVSAGNQVVIPPGTFVQGTVDRLGRRNGRGEIDLQSMTITFPDGYVTPIPGPIVLQTDEGYAIKDPGQGRSIAAVAMPAAGAGVGAAIGHSITPSSSTITSSLPPGCTGPPPGCLSSSMTVPGDAGRNTVIGAGVGGAIGAVASIVMIFGSHHFYLDAGAPVQMKLQQPVTLKQDEVNKAVNESAQHPVAAQAVAPRTAPGLGLAGESGTCWTPGTPGTPPTTIPGPPGPNGIPGPPTVIPGTPATPGTPYPCP